MEDPAQATLMNQAAQPVLTVRSGRLERNFAAGRDVVVGSDLRADLRLAHPLIARAHLLLRFDHGRWIAVDNNSLNGVFLNGQRVPVVDIRDGQTINIGKPDGPCVTFEVGPRREPPLPHPDRPGGPRRTGSSPIIRRPGPASGPSSDHNPPTRLGVTGEVAHFPTTRVKGLGPEADRRASATGIAWIGRSLDNDIVIPDVLASRHHAFLTPTPIGAEIRDAQSINGTFVNGVRVGSAVLTEGDVVTIGNVDLLFTGGILVRRRDVATRAGGLEVREVDFSIDGKRLLERVTLTARPGTLTAIIGGSGAGKTTLSRLIAGYATP
ncbi:MAG TPA: FHA domain-containing protein, partial [Pseudonocardiaceae bacterium]|nr:FHA domain-containing protein [Pseudonocardiaceae bacterium]